MGDGLEDMKIVKYPQTVKLRNPPMDQIFRKSPVKQEITKRSEYKQADNL